MSMRKISRSTRFVLLCLCLLTLFSPLSVTADDGSIEVEGKRTYTYEDFEGKTVGVLTGSIYDSVAAKYLKDPKFMYFPTTSDAVYALDQGRLDSYVADLPAEKYIQQTHKDHREVLNFDPCDYAFVFRKDDEHGQKLCGQFNAFLAECEKNGLKQKIYDLWIGVGNGTPEDIDYAAVRDGENGVLKLVVSCDGFAPMEYLMDQTIVGYEVHLAVEFCKAYGYGLDITDMSFSGILSSVQSGIFDFAASSVSVTEERKKAVLFSDPDLSSYVVLVTKDDTQTEDSVGFFASIGQSLYNTFIMENRWQLFLKGIGNTMLITVLSILIGTLFGFVLFLLCDDRGKILKAAVKFCCAVVHGLPVVVLLMIFYYIVLAKTGMSNVMVCVAAFSLTFGCSVFGMLQNGVGTIDRGQYEAAFTLGFGRKAALLQVILPQALGYIFPNFRAEVVSLIKATAVVGYIAVQDLTRQSDIVRGLTFEAFFPLFATALIYFALEAVLIFVVRNIEIGTDKRRRKPEKILKGVKADEG